MMSRAVRLFAEGCMDVEIVFRICDDDRRLRENSVACDSQESDGKL